MIRIIVISPLVLLFSSCMLYDMDFLGEKSNFVIEFAIGDATPDGKAGKIFFVADGLEGRPKGFMATDTGEIYHYLVGYPIDIKSLTLSWTSVPSNIETGAKIGAGRKNTYLINKEDPASPMLRNSGLDDVSDDWFVPSIDELTQVMIQTNIIGPGTFGATAPYWSSTQEDTDRAWGSSVNPGGVQAIYLKSSVRYIRLIRYF